MFFKFTWLKIKLPRNIFGFHSTTTFFYRSRTFSKKNEVVKFLQSWIRYFLKIENFRITKLIYKNILVILHFALKLGGSIVTAHLKFLEKDGDAFAICAFVISFLAPTLTNGSNVNPDILLDYDVNRTKVMFGFISMAVKTVFTCKLILFSGRKAFQSVIKDPKIRLGYQADPDSQSICQRFCIVMSWLSLSLLCGIFIPDFGKVIELHVCLAVFLIDNILNSDPSLICKKSKLLFVVVGLLLVIGVIILGCVFFQDVQQIICTSTSGYLKYHFGIADMPCPIFAWWVLRSKVFAQKSTIFKWNCCIL